MWRRRIIIAAIVLACADLGIRGWIAYRNIAAARTAIQAITTDVGSRTPVQMAADLQIARTHISRANAALSWDPVWWAVSRIPVLGRTPYAIDVSVSALDDVLAHTGTLERGLRGLKHDNIAHLSTGFVDVASRALKEVAPAVVRADAQLQGLNLAGVPAAIAVPLGEARDKVHALAPQIDEVGPLLRVAPALLGMDKPRTWLLLMQNGAEARATGGLVGAVGLLRADQGRLQLTRLESNDRLADVVVRGWQRLVADDGAVDIYRDQMSSLLGFNMNPDFPTVARLAAAMKTQADGTKLDGVMAMDEHTLSHLMSISGPVTIDGSQVTDATVVEFVTKTVYARYMRTTSAATVARKDAILRRLISSVFSRLGNSDVNPFTVVKAVSAAALDGRLSLWSTHPRVQRDIINSPLAHALSGALRPTALVTVNNGGGNKLEAYIGAKVEYARGTCVSDIGARKAVMTVTLTNSAPTSGLVPYTSGRIDLGQQRPRPQGTNREMVYFYLPRGSELDSAFFDGDELFPNAFGRQARYRVIRFDVESVAGRSQKLVVNYSEPIDDAALRPTLAVQPMTVPMTTSVLPAAMCPAGP